MPTPETNSLVDAASYLKLVEHDLLDVWQNAELDSHKPLVVVDWSEIFAYASTDLVLHSTQHESAEEQEAYWQQHYAALSFLFFRLPCTLVLLPSYVLEMENCLKGVKSGALSRKLQLRFRNSEPLIARADMKGLLDVAKDPALAPLFEGSSGEGVAQHPVLTDQARLLLKHALQEHVPQAYLRLQEEAAVDFVRRVAEVLGAKNSNGTLRFRSLAELENGARIARHEHEPTFWLPKLRARRSRSEIANRIDALALDALERLAQVSFYEERPVFFASRSQVMAEIMSGFPGSFPPTRRGFSMDGYDDASCARSWEYFAEVGYFLDPSRSGVRKESLEALRIRRRKLEALIRGAEENRSDSDDEASDDKAKEALNETWRPLRVTFDLEGLDAHWSWKRYKNPADQRIVSIIGDLMSLGLERLVEEKQAVATSALRELEEKLERFRTSQDHRSTTSTDSNTTSLRPPTSLFFWELLDFLEPERVARSYCRDAPPPLVDSLFADLRGAGVDASATGVRVLEWLNEENVVHSRREASELWLGGLALYALDSTECLSIYDTWFTEIGGATVAEPELIARATLARFFLRRERRHVALSWLDLGGHVEQRLGDIAKAVWWNLGARFRINWMTDSQERRAFPREKTNKFFERFLREIDSLDSQLSQASALSKSSVYHNTDVLRMLYSSSWNALQQLRISGRDRMIPYIVEGADRADKVIVARMRRGACEATPLLHARLVYECLVETPQESWPVPRVGALAIPIENFLHEHPLDGIVAVEECNVNALVTAIAVIEQAAALTMRYPFVDSGSVETEPRGRDSVKRFVEVLELVREEHPEVVRL